MTSKAWTCALLVGGACALVARAARADTVVEHDDHGYPSDDYAWNDSHLASGIGVSVTLGGGISGFTDHTLRDTTSPVGGLWDLRAAFGTHAPIAVELAYLGTATQIQSLFGVSSAMLIGTTLEGDLRLNIMPHYVFDPYAFVGVGWTRYDIDEHFTLADTGIANEDNVVEIPVGGGMSYRFDGLVADVRGTFRATRGSNLVLEEPAVPTQATIGTQRFAPMHSWEASVAIGYEF